MTNRELGSIDGDQGVHRLVLGSEPGVVLHVLTLGARVQRLDVTGAEAVRRSVVLAHTTPEAYLVSPDYLGGTIGRYANRIAEGRFLLDGREVRVGAHDRGNHLHGGPDGFDRRPWTIEERSQRHAVLRLASPDGDQGFPGNLTARVQYEVDGTVVRIVMTATADKTTIVNLTNHAYFNLDGPTAGTVDEHHLSVNADLYTPVDDNAIPLGSHAPVAGTDLDLRTAVPIGVVIRSSHEQVAAMRGLDHNFVIRGDGMRTAAVLRSQRAGLQMTVSSDQPGLQVYSGNALDGSCTPGDARSLRQGDGVALEPQLFPDSPNHPEWPSAQLEAGKTYRHEINWEFTPLPPET